MTTLIAERRTGPRSRAHARGAESDARQESLFGGEALASPPRPPTVAPWAARVTAAPVPRGDVAVGAGRAPANLAPPAAAPADPVLEVRPAERPSGAPLARPTLDDAVSRAWESLLIGLPAGCLVCGGELQTSLGGPPHGACGTCGSSID